MDVLVWRSRLLTGHWFNNLPADLQDSLLANLKLRRLTPGQRLFSRGDAPCGLYAVLEGAVRIGSTNQEGKEALLGLIELPYWFGEISLFDGQPRTHDAFAVGPTILLHISQEKLHRILDDNPQYWRQFALLMSQKLRLTFISLEQLSLMPAPARLAHRLLLIAEGYGEIHRSRELILMPQEQLALMLSLSRQTTNQILKDLEHRAIVRLSYGEIEILDLDLLREAARG